MNKTTNIHDINNPEKPIIEITFLPDFPKK